ncbi:MAG: recombinase family protein [Lachnospiraceae bacterium]|nr:recombinase family protein [Lachnospiraceae bacterium]
MNIAAYCRVSTDKADQLNSLEAQKGFFEEYTSKTGDNLVRIYADEGISGVKIKNRTEFQRLMRDARHGLFDMVVVKDISRFARNTVDLLNSTRQLKALGIETQFLTANMTSMGNSEFVLTIFGALAQEESANTSKRVKFGKKINAEKGRVPNIVYGYDKIKGDYFNLTINEFEAKIIQRIFDLYLNGGYGANKIAQILNSEGIRTKRECKWSQNAISRILTNELYTGKVINGKQEVADFLTGVRADRDESEWYVMDKPELRIIEDDTFVKAARLLEQRNNSFNINHERQSNKHLYSTLIKCACCGYSFRRTERCYKNTYIKWVCSGRNANGKDSCNNTTKVDEQELTDALKEYFAGILSTRQDAIKNIVAEFNRIYHSRDDNSEYEQELTEHLAKASKTRKKYMDMYEDELITREELREKVSALNIEIEKCKNELKLVKYNLSKGDQLEQVLHNTFKDLESILAMEHMTNAQLKRVIDKIVVDEHGKIDVYLKLLSDIGLEQSVLVSNSHT